MPLPTAQEVLIAQAVVAELNDPSRPWAGVFTAARDWLLEYGVEDLASLKVGVVPETIAAERVARNSTESAYEVSVDFQLKVAPGDLAGPDSVCAAAQAVFDYYAGKTVALTNLPGWYVAGARREEVYVWFTLYAEKVMETAVVLTVKGAR